MSSVKRKQIRVNLSPDECAKTAEQYEAWTAKRTELGIEGAIVMVANGKICYLDEKQNIFAQGASELIARVSWNQDGDAGVWRWGHTLKDFRDTVAPKKEFKDKYMNGDIMAGADIMIWTTLRKCAVEYKYDFVQEIRLGPSEKEKYMFGVRGVAPCSKENSIVAAAPIERLREVVAAVEERRTDNLPENMGLQEI